tara:strand:- start:369 stop:755 length:387 start_codon:yes stop_codon:yes gene_type:complete
MAWIYTGYIPPRKQANGLSTTSPFSSLDRCANPSNKAQSTPEGATAVLLYQHPEFFEKKSCNLTTVPDGAVRPQVRSTANLEVLKMPAPFEATRVDAMSAAQDLIDNGQLENQLSHLVTLLTESQNPS